MTAADDLLALDQRHVWHPFTQAATAPAPIPIRRARGLIILG
jgi:adenosylmethionine---8-amino-7-oxononanoate aminotransferase